MPPDRARVDMKVIGLTGRMASGKSTVSSILKSFGAEVIDGDAVGHEVMAKGSPVWRAVRSEFGDGILAPDGEIDRAKLGAIVFSRPDRLRTLSRLVHPAIRREVARRIELARSRTGGPPPAVVVDAAVLLEAGMQDLVDEVWVVEADPETRASRLVERTGMSLDQAWMRIRAQEEVSNPIGFAHVVIRNAGGFDDLKARVKGLWERLVDGTDR